MIRILKQENLGQVRYVELSCSSGDTKPVEDMANGSIAVEADTGDVYFYEETNGWVKQFSFQSE